MNGLLPSARRIAIVCGMAIPACAALAGMLVLLPSWCAVGTMLAGLVLFKIGHQFEWRWTMVTGGVMMFGGVFAAAVLGAIK